MNTVCSCRVSMAFTTFRNVHASGMPFSSWRYFVRAPRRSALDNIEYRCYTVPIYNEYRYYRRSKALRRSLPPAGGKKFQPFFPRRVLQFCNDPIEGSCKIKFCTATRCGRCRILEKHFARSERHGFYTATSSGCVELNRAWPLNAAIARSTEAQNGAKTPSKKMQSIFFDL